MSEQPTVHKDLISGGAVLAVLAALVLWASNPDKESFHRHYKRVMVEETEGGLAGAVAARIASGIVLELGDWEFTDYGFFSIAENEAFDAHYFGILGCWNKIEQKKTK